MTDLSRYHIEFILEMSAEEVTALADTLGISGDELGQHIRQWVGALTHEAIRTLTGDGAVRHSNVAMYRTIAGAIEEMAVGGDVPVVPGDSAVAGMVHEAELWRASRLRDGDG